MYGMTIKNPISPILEAFRKFSRPAITPDTLVGLSDNDLVSYVLQNMNEGTNSALIAGSLANVVTTIVAKQSWARRVCRERKLEQGQANNIPSGSENDCFISYDGKVCITPSRGRSFTPDEFKVTAFPSMDVLSLYKAKGIDILDRVIEAATLELVEKENASTVLMFSELCNYENRILKEKTFTRSLSEAITLLNNDKFPAKTISVNRSSVADLLMSDNFVLEDNMDQAREGFIGRFENVPVISAAGLTGDFITPGTAFVTTDPAYFAEMGVRLDYFAEPYSEWAEGNTQKGWGVVGIQSRALFNSKGIWKIDHSS